MVGYILAEREFAIDLEAREQCDAAEVVGYDFGTLVKLLFVALCPPVLDIAILVKLASLIVKSMGHLVSDGSANAAIVVGFVSGRDKKWRLQDAGREANLIGGGIVVGVDGLWGHEPLGLVDGLVDFLLDLVVILVDSGAA